MWSGVVEGCHRHVTIRIAVEMTKLSSVLTREAITPVGPEPSTLANGSETEDGREMTITTRLRSLPCRRAAGRCVRFSAMTIESHVPVNVCVRSANQL